MWKTDSNLHLQNLTENENKAPNELLLYVTMHKRVET